MKTKTHTGQDVLGLAGAVAAGSRNEGRYWFTERFSWVRQYWATVGTRASVDHFGIQFCGVEGQRDAAYFQLALEEAGFYRRNDTRNNATFARKIPFNADGQPDSAAIQQARRDIDTILATLNGPVSPQDPLVNRAQEKGNFATELRNSLPFFIDLELPERSTEALREISF